MTLQQLKYVTTIANIGSNSEAAKRTLHVSQPSLTKAIKNWKRKWALPFSTVPIKGLLFLKKGNVSSAMRQVAKSKPLLLEEQYKSQSGGKKTILCFYATLPFAVNAFVELLKGAGIDQYDVSLRETQTYGNHR